MNRRYNLTGVQKLVLRCVERARLRGAVRRTRRRREDAGREEEERTRQRERKRKRERRSKGEESI
jgi:hypothetical protein